MSFESLCGSGDGSRNDGGTGEVESGGVSALLVSSSLDSDSVVLTARKPNPILLRRSRLVSTAISSSSYVLSPTDATRKDVSNSDALRSVTNGDVSRMIGTDSRFDAAGEREDWRLRDIGESRALRDKDVDRVSDGDSCGDRSQVD